MNETPKQKALKLLSDLCMSPNRATAQALEAAIEAIPEAPPLSTGGDAESYRRERDAARKERDAALTRIVELEMEQAARMTNPTTLQEVHAAFDRLWKLQLAGCAKPEDVANFKATLTALQVAPPVPAKLAEVLDNIRYVLDEHSWVDDDERDALLGLVKALPVKDV